MITPGQRSLPLVVHNRFVITFTNTLFHINWLRRIFRRISSSLLEQTTEQHTRQVFTRLISALCAVLSDHMGHKWYQTDVRNKQKKKTSVEGWKMLNVFSCTEQTQSPRCETAGAIWAQIAAR